MIMNFIPYEMPMHLAPSHPHDHPHAYAEPQPQHIFHPAQYPTNLPDHSTGPVPPAGPAEHNETKPRLSKEEVELLENHFQAHQKPNSNTKRQLAEGMNVDVARINVRRLERCTAAPLCPRDLRTCD